MSNTKHSINRRDTVFYMGIFKKTLLSELVRHEHVPDISKSAYHTTVVWEDVLMPFETFFKMTPRSQLSTHLGSQIVRYYEQYSQWPTVVTCLGQKNPHENPLLPNLTSYYFGFESKEDLALYQLIEDYHE